jgi:hypothetical protein
MPFTGRALGACLGLAAVNAHSTFTTNPRIPMAVTNSGGMMGTTRVNPRLTHVAFRFLRSGNSSANRKKLSNGRPTVAHYFPAGARRRCLPLSSGHTGWLRPPVWRPVSAWRAVIQERRRAGTSPGAVASRVCLDDSTQLLLPSGCPGGGYPRQSRPPMGPSMGQPCLAGPVVL